VDEGQVILRLVAERDFDRSLPSGQRVRSAALQTSDFTPSDQSYGASVYVVSRLGGTDLQKRLNKQMHIVAQIDVAALLALGIQVVYSPEDCDVDELKVAHASLIGVTHYNRPAVLRLIDKAIG